MMTEIYPHFYKKLLEHSLFPKRSIVEIIQVNIGEKCNMACHHCHIASGPKSKNNMDRKTVNRILELLKNDDVIHTVDITGGAPELNHNFRYLVSEVRKIGKKAIDRCNLTVLLEKDQEDTAEFLAENNVRIICSLPCYSHENLEKQRGRGAFNKSIKALKILNGFGYGIDGTGLMLDIVYNPLGAFLPPDQKTLESTYKIKLMENFGISFNKLFTMANMPIKRFEHTLKRDKKLGEYATLLAKNFNPDTVMHTMCRELISIGWNGSIYDCDFNQSLNIPIGENETSIWDIETFNDLDGGSISFDNHCYGCTAGAGSSCSGTIT